ncbi:DUF1622 domain-containing protein [Tsuneonella sp. HG222]
MLAIATDASRLFELAGIAAIILGALFAAGALVVSTVARGAGSAAVGRADLIPAFRKTLGRSILIGLELLVAADIIRTVAIEPTLRSVLVLGLIVIIRTFLSFSLEVEIDGKWPWQSRKDQ